MNGFKLAVVSDIHLGNKRNTADFIIKNLRQAFPNNSETADLDMIVLAGDVFDDLLHLSDPFIHDIDCWITDFLRLCVLFDITVRVIKGTPSHDWNMSARFHTLNHISEIGCDLKYVDELSIEHIDRFNIDVLYVPDEWDESCEKTLSQVHQLMTLKGIKQVDYAFMHGQFEFQLPEFVKAPRHDSASYLSIVRKLIFIGHVHIFSRHDRIIAQGSFDRLSHNEQSAKGHVRAVVYDEDYELTFVENKNARRFDTIECSDLDLAQTLKTIESVVKDIPDESFVRISCTRDNPILTNMDQLAKDWPTITWSKVVRETEDDIKNSKNNSLSDNEFIPITITRDNIHKLITERLVNKNITPKVFSRCEQFILEMR